jgi:hypothetical protein
VVESPANQMSTELPRLPVVLTWWPSLSDLAVRFSSGQYQNMA